MVLFHLVGNLLRLHPLNLGLDLLGGPHRCPFDEGLVVLLLLLLVGRPLLNDLLGGFDVSLGSSGSVLDTSRRWSNGRVGRLRGGPALLAAAAGAAAAAASAAAASAAAFIFDAVRLTLRCLLSLAHSASVNRLVALMAAGALVS